MYAPGTLMCVQYATDSCLQLHAVMCLGGVEE